MPNLLHKPFGAHGKVHAITPASAGWRYVGFSLYRLRAGERVGEATGEREVILVMVEGKAAFTAAGQDWGRLGERMSVFERSPPHCLYVPDDDAWEAVAETDCTIAVCSAPGKSRHKARRIGPEGIALTERGKGTNTRYINNIAMENEDYCDSLLVTGAMGPLRLRVGNHVSDVEARQLERVEFAEGGERATAVLRNGDSLSGELGGGRLDLTLTVGPRLAVHPSAVKAIVRAPATRS